MSRRNQILLILFVVTGGLAIAVKAPWKGDSFARTQAKAVLLFPGLDEQREDIARVVIESGGVATNLILQNGNWLVEERFRYQADLARLANLIDGMVQLDSRNVVSVNPDKRETYKVRMEDGTRIRLFDAKGTVMADLISGALRSQDVLPGEAISLAFYLRRQDRNEVILSSAWAAPVTEPSDWVESRLFGGIETEDLDWLQRVYEGSQFTWKVERIQGEAEDARLWKMTQPDQIEVNQAVADFYAEGLLNLRIADVAQFLDEEETPNREWQLGKETFWAGFGDQGIQIQMGAPAGSGLRYAWMPGTRWVYLVEDAGLDRLRLSPEDFQTVEPGSEEE